MFIDFWSPHAAAKSLLTNDRETLLIKVFRLRRRGPLKVGRNLESSNSLECLLAFRKLIHGQNADVWKVIRNSSIDYKIRNG